eukprot:TRINITY_DN18911_c0_g1_i2.p1 TRINITY_DN18911_c0_g1~~TRINITY_DN18911_c0_g1_i2.p1  ORF type:complete len:348 (+),score=66.93 TRINITY_DN18911_c0_g1_i2:77-1120(+)
MPVTLTCELLTKSPDLGYRALHSKLQQEGFNVALNKVQKFLTQCRSEPGESCKDLRETEETTKAASKSPSLECVDIPGKGIGVLAKQEIPAGTLVMLEKPVLQTRDENRIEFLMNELSDDVKAEVMKLHNDFSDEPTTIGIFHTNSMACPSAGNSDFDAPRGLFLNMSRFNHSCSPNAMQSWIADRGEMQLRAVRSISKGEEICICYIDPSSAWEQRQQDFKENFGFLCRCPVCSAPSGSEERISSDRNRAQMQSLREKLATTQDPAHCLRIIDQLLVVYTKEGLVMPIVTAQLAGHAFNMAAAAGRPGDAKSYAQLAAESYEVIFGKDHQKTREFKQLANRARNLR